MKRKNLLLGILAITLVFTMMAVGCGNDSTDDNGPKPIKFISTDTSGNTYTLVVTPGKANKIAKDDSYVLTISITGQPDKVSKGTISNVSENGTLTMQPKNSEGTFTVTVTDSGQMTEISGSITVGEGEGQSVTAPGEVTPQGGKKITIDGWTWGPGYTDNKQGGKSTITMTQGTGNDNKKITFTGTIQKIPGEAWGMAGCGVEPNAVNLAALKKASSISFKCKGKANSWRVDVRTSNITDTSAHYRKTFEVSETEKTIVISYDELTQPTWVTKVDFNKNLITHLIFEVSPGTEEEQFDITIWDLKAVDQGGSGGGTASTFTLTGIPTTYNGKYAIIVSPPPEGSIIALMGCESLNMTTETFTLSKISNGSVSIPMWTASSGAQTLVKYSGNDTRNIAIFIHNTSTVTGGIGYQTGMTAVIEFNNVTFTNGGAARTWNQGQVTTNPNG